jgi:neopullulanase
MTKITPNPPAWVADAIFYQIFPDRFARSARVHKPGHLQQWGSPPTRHGFQGGDLLGVVEHLDHLEELGVNAIYLNPVFKSASNHRYHTYDYFEVDPLLGGNAALRELLDAAHARGIRVILDGVFNHASRGFWAFHHIMETGLESPYIDWFTIYGFPLRAYDSSEKPNYAAWWGLPALPKFDINNSEVREYLLSVGEHWMRFGIDGWRLDVPEEITVPGFWEAFRQRVRAINPEAYLVGEIWHLAPQWVRGDRFDGLMNYPVGLTALDFFAARTLRTELGNGEEYPLQPLTASGALQRLIQVFKSYEPAVQRAHLNMMDSHDTPRALTAAGEDHSALHLAILMQMTLPGAPSIYYGTEVGLAGARDPDCRRAFPWDRRRWHQPTWEWTKAAVALRRAQPLLRHGRFTPIYGEEDVLA